MRTLGEGMHHWGVEQHPQQLAQLGVVELVNLGEEQCQLHGWEVAA